MWPELHGPSCGGGEISDIWRGRHTWLRWGAGTRVTSQHTCTAHWESLGVHNKYDNKISFWYEKWLQSWTHSHFWKCYKISTKNIFIGIGHYYQWVKRHSVQIVLSLLCQGSVSQCWWQLWQVPRKCCAKI